MGRRRDKGQERAIAADRIERLLQMAHDERHRPDRSKRYVELARKIGMRYQVSIPGRWRRRICRSCHVMLTPGRDARVRVRRGTLRVTCARCGRTSRYGTLQGAQEAVA